ncbi:MAG: electron transfer flavoprotein alpha subunit [Thermoleophilaceae bacterium]|nr:electron transfer flavoprotein alpha subunit [Thermoleophilaceae bacterium]
MSGILTYVLHYQGEFNKNSLGAVSQAAKLAGEIGGEAAAVVVGDGDDLTDDLLGHAAAAPRGEAGADLEAEQAAAEQRVVVVVVLDDLRHHVHDRLGESLGRLGPVDLRRAVLAERRAELVGQIITVADDDRGGLAADLAGQPGRL